MSTDNVTDTEEQSPQCLVHMRDFDAECEHCQTELNVLQGLLMKVVKNNQAAEGRIARLGMGIDGNAVTMLRLNTLINFIFGGNEKMRTIFELQFANTCAEVLANTEREATRQRLTGGIHINGAPIKP